MIIVLALSLFIGAGYMIADLYSSIKSARATTSQVYVNMQALYVFRSAIELGLAIVRSDDPSIDHLGERWAYPLEFKTERGELSIRIYDEDRFINLNYAGDNLQVFENIWQKLRLDRELLQRLLIWIGKSQGQFETDFPIKRAPLSSKEELMLLGFGESELNGRVLNQEFLPGLLSISTVYSSGKVNINTAPASVLALLDPSFDSATVSRIIEHRKKTPFRKVDDLVLVQGVSLDALYRLRNFIDVKSTHFHIEIEVKSGGYSASYSAIFDRSRNVLVYKKVN
ncbi:MAG: type II secretion system protein GspK [Aquificaceae bacterium]|nr:type II secretion system protein GspK [Aquificaceae bacterium]MDW8237433.1 type II secretion system protein GspK [Aquificaceae bacterium]